jgi:hypothetical protein
MDLLRRASNVRCFGIWRQPFLKESWGSPHEKRVATGLFVREGEAAEEFFITTEGRVTISQITPDGHRVMLRGSAGRGRPAPAAHSASPSTSPMRRQHGDSTGRLAKL